MSLPSMLRIVSSGTANASCFSTAMTSTRAAARARAQTRQLGAHELQVDPGLALLARAAQQVGRMISDDQRTAADPKAVNLTAQAADRRVGCEQVLGGNTTDGQNQQRLQQLDLPVQI